MQARLAFLGLLLAAVVPQATCAEDFPSKTVRMVVPFDPGTGPDILARSIGTRLAEKWSVPVVVENRPGAATAVGAAAVAKAPPDGHTIMVTANTLVLNKSLRPSAAYDPVGDFVAIAPLAIGQLALVVHPSLGVSSVKELIAIARTKPGAIDYASPANGTPHHLAMEMFKQAAAIDLRHIPYTTTGAAMQGLLGGQTQVMFLPVHVALPHIQANRLGVLAAGGTRRTAATPKVPSLAEASGIGNVDVDIWFGMYAPAQTPGTIVAKINADVNRALQLQDVQSSLAKQGLAVTGGTAHELAATTKADLERWSRVVRDAHIRAD